MKLASETFAISRIFSLMSCVVTLILFSVLIARYFEQFRSESSRNFIFGLRKDSSKRLSKDFITSLSHIFYPPFLLQQCIFPDVLVSMYDNLTSQDIQVVSILSIFHNTLVLFI